MLNPPYHREGDHWLIEMRLANPRQLFNTIDPSPFHEKDLDDAAERYLVEAVEDFAEDSVLKLVIYLPDEYRSAAVRAQFVAALEHFFAWRVQETRRQLRDLLADGRLSMLVGLAFLMFCTIARQLAVHFTDGFLTHVIDEGLLIIGWVALWHPTQRFLYDWWPVRRRMRILRRVIGLAATLELR